ncbi:MAG: hypothetical protein H0Z39_06740 [Peptococcaceae bacterium]|nr:hypothetical protein [Peptococcaceae bacterium]
MIKGKVRKFFPGGNTCRGFYSYYDYIIKPDATRILVIKGGPGVGKSTFMRKIGEEMRERGYDIEYHCCSSDNGSIDGVVIPDIGVALIDGTAPHVVDPKNPGAVDEIIHLGDFWNEDLLRANKENVLNSNRRVGRLFQIAYCQLAEAKVIKDEMESYVTESQNFALVNRATADLLQGIFGRVTPQYEQEPRDRHLFASAISPEGVVNHIGTLLQDITQIYVIKGMPGTGRSTLVKKIAGEAHALGLDTEVYHCAFEPEEIDLVVIPSLQAAVLKNVAEVGFDPGVLSNVKVTRIDLDEFVNRRVLDVYSVELMSAKERFAAALNRAIRYISDAKLTHDYMESFYIPAMDFDAIEQKRRETLKRILQYAEEVEV